MIKIDLITGFLGSGKTTFIQKYAQYLINQGYKIGIIENDFGAVNVDMLLLQNALDDQCDLEMISGGCDQQTHQRRLKTKLISMGMMNYDRIIMEPSGIFDMDEFFDILYEEPLNKWYEIGNVIAIVNARLEDTLSSKAEYLLASQIAYAGSIILSQSQNATEIEIQNTINHLSSSLKEVKCHRMIKQDILSFHWDDLAQEQWKRIMQCGYVLESFVKKHFSFDQAFTSLYLFHIHMDQRKLYETIQKIMNDQTCGDILRIKGFLSIDQDQWIELNATRQNIMIQSTQVGQEVIIVIGENLHEEIIQRYFKNHS